MVSGVLVLLKVWARVVKLGEEGPPVKTKKKSWEMIVNPDVDVHTKTHMHQKTLIRVATQVPQGKLLLLLEKCTSQVKALLIRTYQVRH